MNNPRSNKEVVLACNLSVFTETQREQHLVDAKQLLSSIFEIQEMSDGYRLRLPSDDETFRLVADFIRDESLCCPFFHFRLDVEPNREAIWLSMTGQEGVKQLMLEEMQLSNIIDSLASQ